VVDDFDEGAVEITPAIAEGAQELRQPDPEEVRRRHGSGYAEHDERGDAVRPVDGQRNDLGLDASSG
jgi:hypothetical protein